MQRQTGQHEQELCTLRDFQMADASKKRLPHVGNAGNAPLDWAALCPARLVVGTVAFRLADGRRRMAGWSKIFAASARLRSPPRGSSALIGPGRVGELPCLVLRHGRWCKFLLRPVADGWPRGVVAASSPPR